MMSPYNYYTFLDSHCEDLKEVIGGSIGWFDSDNQELGYGIYNSEGNLKFPSSPHTSC